MQGSRVEVVSLAVAAFVVYTVMMGSTLWSYFVETHQEVWKNTIGATIVSDVVGVIVTGILTALVRGIMWFCRH